VKRALAVLVVTASILLANSPQLGANTRRNGAGSERAWGRVTDGAVELGNGMVERTWARDALRTVALRDLRAGGVVWGTGHRDFAVTVGGVTLGSDQLRLYGVRVDRIAGGMRAHFWLSGPGFTAEHLVDVFDDVAGFRTQTILHTSAPLPVDGARLEETATPAAAPTMHAFRAGADWRSPGETWAPQLSVGDAHTGDWRDTHAARAGESLAGPGQWLSLQKAGRSLFFVSETNDLPSNRVAYDGATAGPVLDYTRDVASLGPFEEQFHAENPLPADTPAPAGVPRVVDGTLTLTAVFVGVGTDADDEAWQFHHYLTAHRLQPYAHDVVFNSNGTDTGVLGDGAKDDMNYKTVVATAPIAKRLGIETFVLDDGWQAESGDWVPDPTRFPDQTFAAVRKAIAPMKLGLWMSPMHFHPDSQTWRTHPDWVCAPVGAALAAYNAVQPTGGSNEAGIAEWGPNAVPFIEQRLRTAITQWGVSYFKFDFLAWLTCAGQGDLHDMHDAFVAMLDRLRTSYPDVTFQIDETNDYRLFPFESTSRGPTWFQNGTPDPAHLLHNLWDLSPWVPAAAIGQHFLGGDAYKRYPVDTLMAEALLSHPTFFSDLRALPAPVIDAAAPWLAFYKAHRSLFTDGVVYPLLADPLKNGWTALQAWDPVAARGALLAFRQSSPDATATIALRDVPPGRTFALLDGPTGRRVGTATSAQLTAGLPVRLDAPNVARVTLIVPT